MASHPIAKLGGTPDLTTPTITPVSTTGAALQKDVEAEIHAIDQYEEHADLISDGDVV